MGNFHNVFSFWNNILTFIGLNYLKQYNVKGQTIYKRSFLKFLFCAFIVTLWIGMIFFYLTKNKKKNEEQVDAITKIFFFIILLTELLASFLLVLIYAFNSKKYMNILTNYNIDLLDYFDYKNLKKSFTLHCLVAIILLLPFYFFNVWANEAEIESLDYYQRYAFAIIWFVFPIYNFTSSCHFFIMSKWLHVHFKKINKKLKSMRLCDIYEIDPYIPQLFDEKKLWVSPAFKKIINFKKDQTVSIVLKFFG